VSQRQRRRKARSRSSAAVVGVAVGAAVGAGVAPASAAAAITVTNLDDHGTGSLRDAIGQANAAANPDQIVFHSGLSGQITLEQELTVTSPVDITGPGPGVVTISGDDKSRILHVTGAPDAGGTLSDLTLAHGSASEGGAVYVDSGGLTISESVVRDSHAIDGGGVWVSADNNDARVSVVRSTVTGNVATDRGGGLGITAYGHETGAYVRPGLGVDSSTVAGNHAQGGAGGGIFGEVRSYGMLDYGYTRLELGAEYSTIAGNTAGTSGGGIFVAKDDASIMYPEVNSSIVADDTAAGTSNDTATAGAQISGKNNLIEANSGSLFEGTAVSSQDPQLGALQDNGGPTPTMAIPKTSPAVDQSYSAETSEDQRGEPRSSNFPDVPDPNFLGGAPDGTDIGSFELQAPYIKNGPGPGVTMCGLGPATIIGTGHRDVLRGTKHRDAIAGLGGNDVIRGLGGNDVICGGKGKDKLIGGPGKDILMGQAGVDTLLGGPGKDKLIGGPGRDHQTQ
jgi:hypothetical protein